MASFVTLIQTFQMSSQYFLESLIGIDRPREQQNVTESCFNKLHLQCNALISYEIAQ